MEYELAEVRSLAGRLAWVRGEVTTESNGTEAVRPFLAVLVQVGGGWRTVFDVFRSQRDAELQPELPGHLLMQAVQALPLEEAWMSRLGLCLPRSGDHPPGESEWT